MSANDPQRTCTLLFWVTRDRLSQGTFSRQLASSVSERVVEGLSAPGWMKGDNMRNLRLKSHSRGLLLLAGFAGLPLTLARAHEGHHVECNETAINALRADIQVMDEGEARTTATKELEAAEQMMAKNDMEGCKSHVHSAMEATEK
jgi:hypothetical protein